MKSSKNDDEEEIYLKSTIIVRPFGRSTKQMNGILYDSAIKKYQKNTKKAS